MRYEIRRIPYAALALLVVLSADCAGQAKPVADPRRSVEGQAAEQADAVVKAADVVLTGLDTAMTAKVLPTAVGVPIVRAIRQIGIEGVPLADALQALKVAVTTTEKNDASARAQAALLAIRRQLDAALAPITDQATREQVLTLLSQLLQAVADVKAILGPPKVVTPVTGREGQTWRDKETPRQSWAPLRR